MALIKCSECHKDVSDKAPACPNCGNPLINPEENIITIQQTHKRWKLWKLIAVFLLITGFIFLMNGIGGNSAAAGFGAMLLFFGFIIGVIAKLGAWWSNG